jgi:very-short-patch-repair endonuclease
MESKNYPTYRKDLIEKARKLRKSSTPAEIELWKLIKNKQVLGFQFRRQRPIDNFIVDFYCKQLKLAIEIDGNSHDYKFDYDQMRQTKLEYLGITFLRFSESDTKENPDHVVLKIEEWIDKKGFTRTYKPSPQSPPSEGKFSKQTNNLNNVSSSLGRRNKGEGKL